MSCTCDILVFPPPLKIDAGLSYLPRQIATFPEFRAALLFAIAGKASLQPWRARSSDDFGIMLLEMWAYVCDSISFYDEVIANEVYIRTAILRPSLRKMVGLLGYVPRPGVAATVDLAVFADGRQPVKMLAGTAFRSGAFPGGAPQVFELDADSTVHAFTNRWTIAQNRPPTIDGGKGIASLHLRYLRLDPKSIQIKAGQVLLVDVTGDPSKSQARFVKSVSDFPAKDGVTYKRIDWDDAFPVPGGTLIANILLSKTIQKANISTLDDLAGDHSIRDYGSGGVIHLNGLYPAIKAGTRIVLEQHAECRWYIATRVGTVALKISDGVTTTLKDPSGAPLASVTSPPVTITATEIFLDVNVNDPSRKISWKPNWTWQDAAAITVHYGSVAAGTAVAPAWTTLIPGDPTLLTPPFDVPLDQKSPNRFLLEDVNNTGVRLDGIIDFTARSFKPALTTPLKQTLMVPTQLYGNVVTASRGQSVPMELLGIGDGTIENQAFQLKKSPLTYTPSPTEGNEQGVRSTLKVYVDGLLWSEVENFYNMPRDSQVYMVRQDDTQVSTVTFLPRLPTGAVVTATYRFGAEKLSPPAGSIHEMARPVKAIKTVRNPVVASGGDDAEPASGLRFYAPRSALLLGRAISIQDMEAAAAATGGVRAVQAEWHWNKLRQRPVVQIWFVGGASIAPKVRQKLRGLSDPTTPIDVEAALPVKSTLSIDIDIDPRRLEADVLPLVRTALMNADTGMLAPENIGIGRALFRSRIFDAVLAVPGAVAVRGLNWNGAPFDPYGISPAAGEYFDLENGTLLLNGKTGTNG
jgi:hypothetical protein